MPDYTTRLGLAKPSDGENYDVDVVNANSDIVDSAIGARTVTSTTRPSTPYIGQVIYETDTKVVRMWNGTNWTRIGGDPILFAAGLGGNVVGLTPTTGTVCTWNNGAIPTSQAKGGFAFPSSDRLFAVPETGNYRFTGLAYVFGGDNPTVSSLRVLGYNATTDTSPATNDQGQTFARLTTAVDTPYAFDFEMRLTAGKYFALAFLREAGTGNVMLYAKPSGGLGPGTYVRIEKVSD